MHKEAVRSGTNAMATTRSRDIGGSCVRPCCRCHAASATTRAHARAAAFQGSADTPTASCWICADLRQLLAGQEHRDRLAHGGGLGGRVAVLQGLLDLRSGDGLVIEDQHAAAALRAVRHGTPSCCAPRAPAPRGMGGADRRLLPLSLLLRGLGGKRGEEHPWLNRQPLRRHIRAVLRCSGYASSSAAKRSAARGRELAHPPGRGH